jgi:microcystin-dependent protein
MAEPFIAEIRIFGFTFAPAGWAQCSGQIMPISQNTALFSLLGTTYGGNGTSNFMLPNLQGAAPLAPGQGPGMSLLIDLGEQGGSENVTLVSSQMPSHSHAAQANSANANSYSPKGRFWAQDASGVKDYASTSNATMAPGALSPAGGGQSHSNAQPSLVLNFCIALVGIFPPRG